MKKLIIAACIPLAIHAMELSLPLPKLLRTWQLFTAASSPDTTKDDIQHLLRKRADVNGRDWNSETPLMLAAKAGNLAACTALLQGGAAVDAYIEHKEEGSSLNPLLAIFSLGAPPGLRLCPRSGLRAIDFAAAEAHADICALLLRHGARLLNTKKRCLPHTICNIGCKLVTETTENDGALRAYNDTFISLTRNAWLMPDEEDATVARERIVATLIYLTLRLKMPRDIVLLILKSTTSLRKDLATILLPRVKLHEPVPGAFHQMLADTITKYIVEKLTDGEFLKEYGINLDEDTSTLLSLLKNKEQLLLEHEEDLHKNVLARLINPPTIIQLQEDTSRVKAVLHQGLTLYATGINIIEVGLQDRPATTLLMLSFCICTPYFTIILLTSYEC